MADSSAVVWRDFVDVDDPSSGAHRPEKSAVRAWGEDLEAGIEKANRQNLGAFADDASAEAYAAAQAPPITLAAPLYYFNTTSDLAKYYTGSAWVFNIGPGYVATSATSLAIGVGNKTFTTQAGLAYQAGSRVRLAYTTDVTKFMDGIVTDYDETSMTVDVDAIGGTGTFAAWSLQIAGVVGSPGQPGEPGEPGQPGQPGEPGLPGAAGAGYGGTSTSSLTIGTGAQALTTQAGLAYQIGSRVRLASTADVTKYMDGVVTAYSGTSMTVAVDAVAGSGTFAAWTLSVAGAIGVTGAAGPTTAVNWTPNAIRVRSTANVTIASGLTNGTTLNGVVLATGNFVFLGSQTAPAENGLYTVVASGAASRSTFADSAAELARIAFAIQSGTVGSGEGWTLALDSGSITLGTTALNFSPIPAGSSSEVIAARDIYSTLGARLDGNDPIKQLTKEIIGLAASGSVKGFWHFKGPKTLFAGSASIITQLDDLSGNGKHLVLASAGSIYAGTDPRPVYDDIRGLYLSSQAGMQYAGSILSKTSGDFMLAYNCDLNYLTGTVSLMSSLAVSPSIVEGDMFLVNGDTNTTQTPDVPVVMNMPYIASSLVNGYFHGAGNSQTQAKGDFWLFALKGVSSYMGIRMNHLGQLSAAFYSGSGSEVNSISLGTVLFGQPNLSIFIRRFKDQFFIVVNGKQYSASFGTSLLSANVTDLTNLYVNGNARAANTAAPMGVTAIRQSMRGLLICDDLTDTAFREVHNRFAREFSTPSLRRARKMRGVGYMGQSWTQGAIDASTDTWTNVTASGNVWNGQVTVGALCGENACVTRDAFPNVYGSNVSAFAADNLPLAGEIGPLEVPVNSLGVQSGSHNGNSTGENFIMGMFAQINAHPYGQMDDYIVAGMGAGGASLAVLAARTTTYLPSQLKQATDGGNYNTFIRQVVFDRDFAHARGQEYTFDVFVWQQGHSDTATLTYMSDFQNFYQNQLCPDIKAITGQSHNPEVFFPQVNYASDGIRNRGNTEANIDQIFLDMEDAKSNVFPFHMIGTQYQSTGHIHQPRLEHRRTGEMFGLGICRVMFDGVIDPFLRPKVYTYAAASAVVDVRYSILAGRAIAFVDQNENNIAARKQFFGVDSYGFEFYRKTRGNTGTYVAISASTGVCTYTAHGFVNGDKVMFDSTGVLPTGYALRTEYFVIGATANTFGLSATLGGAQIAVSGTTSGNHVAYDTTVKIASVTIPSSVVTMTIASPAVISWVAHGMAIGDKVRFTTTGALPTGLLPNTDYWVNAVPTVDTFRLCRNGPVGPAVATTGTQSGTHTCTAASRVRVTLDTNLAGSVGSMGVLKYTGAFNSYGNICDGPKVDGLYYGMDWAGATWTANAPLFKIGPANDVRQWAAASTKAL